jgi:hypothetical protein
VDSDNLSQINSLLDLNLQQQPQILQNTGVPELSVTDDSPKFDQYLLDSITAAAASSSTSITSSMSFSNFSVNGGISNTQSTNNDPHEMPQLLNILNELLDEQDLAQLASAGGNGDNMQDMVDQEENYEDDSPRKDDPDEISRILAQQRIEEISREEQLLRRRMDFLMRRLYKLVARSTGMHASEEISGFMEHLVRVCKKKEKPSSATKYPYLTANLQGTPIDLLSSPSYTKEPPLNLLSSPTTQEQQKQQPLMQQQQSHVDVEDQIINNTPNNNNVEGSAVDVDVSAIANTKIDVIESPSSNGELKPVSFKEMKSFLRKIDNISTMQSTVLSKKALAFKYFSKPSSSAASLSSSSNLNQQASSKNQESNFSVSAIPKLDDADVDQIDQTSGLLMSELRLIENNIDSDATASSTGGESADEMTPYNNNYQHPLSM